LPNRPAAGNLVRLVQLLGRIHMKPLRARLTYANVVATLALVLALAGGTAFAASQVLPKNSVGPRQIKKGAVTPVKLSKSAKATLTGPRGVTGAQGAKGDTGAKGERGGVGPVGPSTVYAGFYDGGISFENDAWPATAVIVTLPELPAGAYAIQAKMVATSNSTEDDLTECILDAEGDTDTENDYLGEGKGDTSFAPFSLQVVHTFTAPGEVTIKCGHVRTGTPAGINSIKITAIRVGSIASNHIIY
jgi:hypothetical protein